MFDVLPDGYSAVSIGIGVGDSVCNRKVTTSAVNFY